MDREERTALYREIRKFIKIGSNVNMVIHAFLHELPGDSEKSQALKTRLERMCECPLCSNK